MAGWPVTIATTVMMNATTVLVVVANAVIDVMDLARCLTTKIQAQIVKHATALVAFHVVIAEEKDN